MIGTLTSVASSSAVERGAHMTPEGKMVLLFVTFAHLWATLLIVFALTVNVLPQAGEVGIAVMLLSLGATFLAVLAGTILIFAKHLPETIAELFHKVFAEFPG